MLGGMGLGDENGAGAGGGMPDLNDLMSRMGGGAGAGGGGGGAEGGEGEGDNAI